MKSLLTVTALLAVWGLAGTVRAQSGGDLVEPLSSQPAAIATRQAPAPVDLSDHPTPRLKLSYERYSAGNIDGSAMPLEALHLDMYALSWRYVRAGVDVEVSDNGTAGRSASQGAHGLGLNGMRERAAVYAGTVEAGPLPTGGWRVQTRLAVESPAAGR